MAKLTQVRGTEAFGHWLETANGRAAEPWQVELIGSQQLPGAATQTTFDLLLEALRTVRAATPE